MNRLSYWIKKTRFLLVPAAVFICHFGYSQTNTFPADGNVGIGTTSPASKLSIQNAGSTDGVKLVEFSETTTEEFLFKGYFLGAGGTGNKIVLGTGVGSTGWQSNIMSWRGDGNVGIGIISPERLLHITSGNSGDAILRIEADEDNNNEHDNPYLEFYQDAKLTRAEIGYLNDNFFGIANQGSLSGTTRPTIRFGIDLNGNVGIGTSTPQSIFNINTGIDGDAILRIEADTDNAGSEADNARIEMYQDAKLIGVKLGFNEDIATPANHFQIDMVHPGGISKNALTIDPYTGKVGLGILATSEDARLVVDGKILAEEIKVQTIPASDYVFESDYNLRPIQEVESFIKENKHLPDIPSAEEFKENGVGLGEMDDMLLRKVEELTLYVIELKKENEAKAEEIKELKAKGKEIDELKAMVKALMDEK